MKTFPVAPQKNLIVNWTWHEPKTFDNYHLEEENREIEHFYILKKLWKADSNLTRSERQYYPDKNHTFAILNFTFE